MIGVEYVLNKLALRKNVTVGRNFHAGPGSILWAPRQLAVGNDVHLGRNVTVQVDGSIGDNVLIANLVGIVGRNDHDISQRGTPIHDARWIGKHPQMNEPTTIGSDVWIGYGAIVLSGVSIGDSSIVAAGSIVTRDVPPNSIVVGQPARVVGQRFTPADLRQHWARLHRLGVKLQERLG